jgi:predicted RNA methylase
MEQAMIERGELLELGSDRAIRLHHFTDESFQHPAKMHAGLLLWIVGRYTTPGQTICDPMYGIGTTGLAALLQRNVIGLEIEPPFLAEAHRNAAIVVDAGGLFAGRITIAAHDARTPWPLPADVVLFSPPYGCDASGGVSRRRVLLRK